MITWANKITMSEDAAEKAASGETSSVVDFTFINLKTGKEITRTFTLHEAIELAERRREDKRYKNYEYHIG